MAVRNVYSPPVINELSLGPKKQTVPEEVTNIQNEVTKAQAYRQLVQEQALTAQMTNPAEPPFQVRGSVNLGDFDMQAAQQEERNRAEQIRQEAQQKEETLRSENTGLRDQVHTMGLQQLQTNLLTQIEQLKNNMASQGAAPPPDLIGQLNAIEAIASKLGYQRPQVTATQMPSNTFDSQIALERLRAEIKRDDRRFTQEMKKDERLWQIEMIKMNQADRLAAAKLEAESHKWDTISAFPEQLGGAIVKGLLAQPEEVETQKIQQKRQPQKLPDLIEILAEPNEPGEINCPSCESLVGIAPSVNAVSCSSCGQRFQVTRGDEQPASAPAPAPARKEPEMPPGLQRVV